MLAKVSEESDSSVNNSSDSDVRSEHIEPTIKAVYKSGDVLVHDLM